MHFPYCGKQINDGDHFCKWCGKKLPDSIAENDDRLTNDFSVAAILIHLLMTKPRYDAFKQEESYLAEVNAAEGLDTLPKERIERFKAEFHKLQALVNVEHFLWRNKSRPVEAEIQLFEKIFQDGETQGADAPILNRSFTMALFHLYIGNDDAKADKYLDMCSQLRAETDTPYWQQREQAILDSYSEQENLKL